MCYILCDLTSLTSLWGLVVDLTGCLQECWGLGLPKLLSIHHANSFRRLPSLVAGCCEPNPAVLCVVLCCAGLPQLYGYMLTQRRKVLGGGGAAKQKAKAS